MKVFGVTKWYNLGGKLFILPFTILLLLVDNHGIPHDDSLVSEFYQRSDTPAFCPSDRFIYDVIGLLNLCIGELSSVLPVVSTCDKVVCL